MRNQSNFEKNLYALKKGKTLIASDPEKLRIFEEQLKESDDPSVLMFEVRAYEDQLPRVMLKPIFRTGFVFKPTHTEIHYIKVDANLKRSAAYRNKFSTDPTVAQLYITKEAAQAAIDKVLPKPDDEYHYTAIIENTETNDLHKIITY